MFNLRRCLSYSRLVRNLDRRVSFPGATGSSYTEEMSFSRNWPIIPTYRVLDTEGQVIVPGHDPKVNRIDVVG